MMNFEDRPRFVHVEWETGHLNADLYAIALTSHFPEFYRKALKISTNTSEWCGPLRDFIAEQVDTATRDLPTAETEYRVALSYYDAGIEDLESKYTKGTRPYNAARKCIKYYEGQVKNWKRSITDARRTVKYGTNSLALLEKLA